jgi:hypothetical protein
MAIDWSKYGGSSTKTAPVEPADSGPAPIATKPQASTGTDWSKYGGTAAPAAPATPNPIAGAVQKAGRGLGSALGAVGNALDLPLAAAENIVTGKGLGRIPEDLRTGGLSSVAENDVYFRKGSLQRSLEDPASNPQQKAQAQFFLQHPWVAGAADFATEFANPSNLALGGVGRVAGAIGRIPQVAQSLDELQATTKVGSRFAGLRVAARDVARQQNPAATAADQHLAAQKAEQWGRRVVNSGGVADQGAYKQAMSDFGNLTIDQQKEVVHRAQGNVTQDFGPEANATIDKNAQSVVKNIWQATRDQMQQGVISPTKVYGREEMFPGVFTDAVEGAVRRPLSNPEQEAIAQYARGEAPEAEQFTPLVKERGDMLKEQLAKDEPPSPEPAGIDVFRYQRTPGEAQAGSERGGTFYAMGKPGPEDNYAQEAWFSKLGLNPVGGEHQITDKFAPKNPLNVGGGHVGVSALKAIYGDDVTKTLVDFFARDAKGTADWKNAPPEAVQLLRDAGMVPKEGPLFGTTSTVTPYEKFINNANEDLTLVLDRIGLEAAKAKGYDAVIAKKGVPGKTDEFVDLGAPRASETSAKPKVSFFPMAGAFNQPGRDEEYLDFLDHHMGGGPGKIAERKGTAGLNFPSRTHQTLLDAQTNSKVGLRDDWSPAESYYRFLAQRSKNVELEKAMTDLMGTGMAKPAAERTAGDRFANVKDIQSTRMFGSPVLKETAAHQHVVNFLEEVGATKGEASSFAHATTAIGKLAQTMAPAYHASQSLIRQAVIANPIIHAGWNLMGQYLAAGGDIRYLGGVNEQIANDAARYGAITSRGAPRSLSGGSAISLASRPMSDLNPLEKVQRGAAMGQEWNAKVVFDQAEHRYSAALYQTYLKRGMAPEEAGNRVRQALGDYANVANAGVDKVFQQAFFFYPWLKTLLPFWIKTGLTKPQTWNPIVQGIATNNELAGDPNAGTSNVSPFTLYTGSDTGGHPEYFSVPVVSRILTQIGDLVGGALTNNRDEAAKGFKSLLLNRLNPAVGTGLAAGQSLVSGSDQPEGPLGYAPVLERLKTGLAGMGEFIPAPVKGAYDAAQVLLGKEDLKPSVIAGELVGGTGYVSTTPGQKMAASHIRGRFYRIIDNALKRGDRATAWKAYQAMQQTLQKAGLAHDQPKANPEKESATNPLPQAPPEGAIPESAVEAPEEPAPPEEAPQEPPEEPEQPAEETASPSP